MFIGAYHPDLADLQHFMKKLEQQKILLMPGSAFSVTRDYQRFARINCTHFSETLEEHFSV